MAENAIYVVVLVSDLEACTRFYHNTLGLPIERVGERWVRLRSEGTAILLRSRSDRPDSNSVQRVRIALGVQDIDAAQRELRSRSVDLTVLPYPTDIGRQATLQDPEGNLVDLIEYSGASDGQGETERLTVNDILKRSPNAMGVLEEHGIRICGGCIVLLNGTIRETAAYSGLLAAEASSLVNELDLEIHRLAKTE